MKITTKTTRAELAAWIKEQDSLIEALKVTRDELRRERDSIRTELAGVYAEWQEARTKLNAAVSNMGDNNPWKLAGLALVVGIVIGWIGNGVL